MKIFSQTIGASRPIGNVHKNRLRRWSTGLCALMAVSLIASCAASPADTIEGESVKIALVIHQTGPFADTGRMELIGAQLAVDDINSSGGIKSLGGVPVELIVEDAGDSAGSAVSALNRALDKGAVAIEGTGVSSTTLAITEVAERRKIPVLTIAFADEITERGFQYSFATSPMLSEVTKMWATALDDLSEANGTPIDRVMIVSGITVAASGPAKEIRSTYAEKNGWDVVADVTIEENTLTDATPIVEQIVATDPQVLLIGAGVADIQKITRKQTERGLVPVPWVLTGAQYLGQAFLDSLGPEGVEGTMAIASSAPFKEQQGVADKVRAAGDPFPQQYHLAAYSHIHLLREAIEEAASRDPKEIRNALAALDVEGGPAAQAWPSQRVRFDETGRAIDREAVLVQWQGGKTLTVYPTRLAEATPIISTRD